MPITGHSMLVFFVKGPIYIKFSKRDPLSNVNCLTCRAERCTDHSVAAMWKGKRSD